jgi:general secretion pathway protein H
MRARGFTLIEVMVVLVILAITATAVTFSIEGMQARDTEREIDRLRLVLEAAGERAAVHGTPIAAEFLPGRYRFSELDAEGKWRPIVDVDSLTERALPDTLSWAGLTVEGRAANAEPPLIFGAEMPQFELLLHAPDGDRRYRSRPDGSVTLERVAQGPAA